MFKPTRGLAALLLAFSMGLATDALAQNIPPSASVFYPPRAQRMETNGFVRIDCAAAPDGALSDCKVLSEIPEGWGFGDAAVRAAHAGVVRERPVDASGRIQTTMAFDARGSSDSAPRQPPAPVRRPTAEPTVSATVASGQTILSYPFAFTRTAVLTKDLTNVNPLLKVVRVKAGAPGFFLGRFASTRTPPPGTEVWCFLAAPPRKAPARKEIFPAEWVCSQMPEQRDPGFMSTVVDGFNPYAAYHIWWSSNDKVSFGPEFEEKPVTLPVELKTEYRFRRWTDTGAKIEEWVGGERARDLSPQKQADGSVILETQVGEYRLSPSGRSRATVSKIN